jgi:MYXO-CTERM domain-containing protein
VTPIRFAIMPTSRRVPGFLRFLVSRFVLQVAVGAVIVLGLIALLVACAASSQETESVGFAASPLTVAGLFSTGVDGTGTPLLVGAVDQHYTLTSDDPARQGASALVVSPVSGWIASTSTSNWLSAQANGFAANLANYTYTTTFTLAGVDPTTVAISGSWACDDSCVIKLNGMVVASYAAPGWLAAATFTIPAGSPFVTGTNTLAFVVTNSGGGASGLQVVSISGTSLGCTADNQCTTAQFCNTQTATCTGTLPSGTPIPTIRGHNPALDGVCAGGVGAAVCDAGVCDMTNNECGLANGNGPCTATNGATLCQSGACSTNATCEPQGGCNVDGDCTGGQQCDLSTHLCVALPDAGAEGSAGADAGDGGSGDAGGSAGADASEAPDGSQDGAVGSDGSEGEDGGALADGTTEADGTTDAGATADGPAGTDGSAAEDGNARDASEKDAAARAGEDASEEGADGGVSPHKVLEGDGLSCSAARSGSGTTSLPLWFLGVAAAATMRRRRRDATRRRACPARPTCLRRSVGDRGE